jgi:choline dehydrogenase-like flavoprotein
MGTCRMGTSERDSVTDSFGAVHDTPGLYAVGLANFVGAGGALNPTLTATALALRSADSVAEALG